MGEDVNYPSPEQVKLIFKDTYNLYLKYKEASTDKEYLELIAESNEIDNKYPFQLCHVMVLELLNIIEDYCKQGGANNNGK